MNKLILAFLLLFAKVDAVTLHAILVGDTADKTIGYSVRQDLYNVTDKLSTICKETGMNFNRKLLVGRRVNPDEVEAILEKTTVDSDDVILFYYSGHGFRTPNKESPWPYLFCSQTDEGFDMGDVIAVLLEKESRLLLAISDVCNSFVPEVEAPPIIPMAQARSYLPRESGYSKLFLENSGLIVASGSHAGEFALCDERGGFFSLSFFQGLETVATHYPKAKTCWENVLSLTYDYTLEKNQKQHPDFLIELY